MTDSSLRPKRWSARNVTAVLGPTNTGKTHLAIERMLGHETGVIGLPLRLLAREVYGRVAARAGADQVALVTGEEKILPPQPRFWVCTVEAMPRETDAAFVAIDEVQIAADLERGHVFTDRLLNLRGSQETLLLGAATMRGIVEKLLPGAHVVTRPRMSVLSYAGQKKLTRLPERSAVVTFSADEVYGVAELIRRQRGGAAVVLGALSPRTRNKQVEIFQSGDVDFLVATDAIGMGLNLDLDHVAFAANRKFDGYQFRELTAAELAQIAGRAGRHMRDGTFGVTGRVDPFPDPLVEAIESHRFEPVRVLQWRNDQLDFSSLAALKASLDEPASVEGLSKAPPADDQVALETLSRDDEVRDLARSPAEVRRLWDVCRLPDYRKIAPAQHAQLVRDIFGFAAGGVVPDDWIEQQVRQANRTEGDIDTLSSRIAQIRTWTFVANQPDWLADPVRWREETKAVEDALSDALHDRLTKRFVDRRTSVLMRRLRENTMLEAEIGASGDVTVEGQHVGSLQGFRFTPDAEAEGADAKALRGAAQKALATAIADRAERLGRAAQTDIVLSFDGHLRWGGEPIARLVAGDEVLKPRFVILADEQLTGPSRDTVEARLTSWITTHVSTVLKPLIDLATDQSLAGMARGIAFRLVESLGLLDRRDVAEDVRGLDQEARAGLRRLGVRFGAHNIYVPALLKPAPSALLAQLWALKHKDPEVPGLAEMAAISASGRTSIGVDQSFDPDVYRRFGFRTYGKRAVRIDILERLADLIRPALNWGPASQGEKPAGAVEGGRGFAVTPAMTSLLGASGEDLATILKGLGYRVERRPKPAEPVAAEAAEDLVTAASEPGPTPAEVPDTPTPEQPSPQTPVEEPPAEDPVRRDPPAEEPPVEAPPSEAPIEVPPPQEPGGGDKPTAELVLEPATESGAEPAASPEPEMIEVWRPGSGGSRNRSGAEKRDRPPSPRRQARPGEEPAFRGAIVRPRPEPPQGREERPRRPDRPQQFRAGAKGQQDRPERHRRPDRGRNGQGAGGEGSDRLDRQQRPRERVADPDSPFAALAALKQNLEKTKSE